MLFIPFILLQKAISRKYKRPCDLKSAYNALQTAKRRRIRHVAKKMYPRKNPEWRMLDVQSKNFFFQR